MLNVLKRYIYKLFNIYNDRHLEKSSKLNTKHKLNYTLHYVFMILSATESYISMWIFFCNNLMYS